jgi:hypothetical protein
VIDDESKGITPLSLSDVSPGDHTLLVSSPGFDPRTIKIKITAGYKLTSSLSLALSPGQMLVNTPEEKEATPSTTIATTPSPTPKGATPTITKTPTPTPTVSKKTTPSPTPTKKLTTTLTSAPTSSSSVKKVQIKETPTGFLRVRQDASTSSAEVGRVKPGEQYAVLDSKTAGGVLWYKITYTETQDGWVSGEYAVKVE